MFDSLVIKGGSQKLEEEKKGKKKKKGDSQWSTEPDYHMNHVSFFR
jgi:hypothetical protein